MKTFENLLEMAKYYYPCLWDKKRIDILLSNGKITEVEYNSIINKVTNQ